MVENNGNRYDDNNKNESSSDDEKCRHVKESVKVKALEKKVPSLIPTEIKCLTCAKNSREPSPKLFEPTIDSASTTNANEDSSKDTEMSPKQTIFLCLTCVETHCGRYDKKHAIKHFEENNDHSISLNLETYDAWCYKCDEVVIFSTRRNQVVAQAQAVVRKHLKEKEEAKEEEEEERPFYKSWRNQVHVTAPGLTNLGNTCFFNSVMQVVVGTSVLHDVLTSSNPYHNPPHIDVTKCIAAKDNDDNDAGPLTNAFKGFLREMWQTRSGIVTPGDLFNQITKKWQQFRGWRQQDSQELMRFLFDGVKSEELELIKKQYSKSSDAEMEEDGEDQSDSEDNEDNEDSDMEKKDVEKYVSFIDACFGGKLVSVIVCDVCKNCSYSYEEFLDVSLPIKSSDDQFKSKSSFGYYSSPYTYGSSSSNNDPFGSSFMNDVKSNEGSSSKTQSENGSDNEGEDSENQNDEVSSDTEVEEGIPVPNKEERKRIKLLLRDLPSDSGRSTPNSKEQNVTLRDCLKSFVKVETLEGDNSFACDNCWKLKKKHDEQKEEEAREQTSIGDDTDDSGDKHSKDQPNGNLEEMQVSQNTISDDSMEGVQYTGDNTGDKTDDRDLNNNDPTVNDTVDIPDGTTSSSGVDKEGTNDGSPDKIGSSSNDTYSNDNNSRNYHNSSLHTMNSLPTTSSKPEQKYILRKAYKRYLFDSLPPVMVFHLKRFQQVGGRWSVSMRKIDDFVAFDEELDVGDFVVPPEIEEKNDGINNGHIIDNNETESLPNQNSQNSIRKFSTKYRLYGVVVHLGSLYNGHYIAYVLSRNIRGEGEQFGMSGLSYDNERSRHKTDDQRQWIYCSDSSVRAASADDVLNSGAYLLFYERVYE